MINVFVNLIFQFLLYALSGMNYSYYILRERIDARISLVIGMASMYSFHLLLSLFEPGARFWITIGLLIINIMLILPPISRSRLFDSRENTTPFTQSAIISLLILTAISAIYLYMFLRTPLHGFDGLMIYASRARKIFESGLFHLFDKGVFTAHNKYPLLIPLQEFFSGVLFRHFSYSNTFIPHMLYIPAFIGIVMKLFSSNNWIKSILCAAFFMTPVFFINDHGIIYQYADFPLAVFYFASWVFILKKKHQFSLFTAHIMPLLKNEGWILFLIIIIYMIIFDRRELILAVRKYRISTIVILINIILWILIRINLTSYIEEITFMSLINNIRSVYRIFIVFPNFLIGMLDPRYWGIAVILPLILLISVKSARKHICKVMLLAIVPIVIYSFIITVLPGFYSNTTGISNRLAIHVYPVIFFSAFYYALNTGKRIHKNKIEGSSYEEEKDKS